MEVSERAIQVPSIQMFQPTWFILSIFLLELISAIQNQKPWHENYRQEGYWMVSNPYEVDHEGTLARRQHEVRWTFSSSSLRVSNPV
ncbi:hypothetical protein O6H91_22G063900 [Diphasiastrum complanatum]|uniref:Uncharacterized protein n=1 Tax=Diphasiastrum complanatum TaxID=34168 RepID=A0ACC2AG79_DIPCM|nr:hypothetical protein O6H91_22G063900 [Diphasiastrum complanatum]